MMTIHYANGRLVNATSLQDAMDRVKDDYPTVSFRDDFGYEILFADEDVVYDMTIREGARLLCWENDERSVNDDGQHAVASIRSTK